MFGRFIALARSRAATVHACRVPMAPRALACWLPQLGGVLCLWPAPVDTHGQQAPGLLVERAELSPLQRIRWLQMASEVTADGPCEWADALDAEGRVRARIYLLPGTDYCAWDALPSAAVPRRATAVAFRATGAGLVRFRHRCLAGLDLLGAESCTMSRLDRRIAGELLRREAVALPVC